MKVAFRNTWKMIDAGPFNWLDLAVILSAFAACSTLVGLALRLVNKAIATKKRKNAIRRHAHIPSGLSSEPDHANKP
jgi:hypothetical protein